MGCKVKNAKDRRIEQLKTKLILAENAPKTILSVTSSTELNILGLEIAHSIIDFMERNGHPVDVVNPSDSEEANDFRQKLVKFKDLYSEMVRKKVEELNDKSGIQPFSQVTSENISVEDWNNSVTGEQSVDQETDAGV